MLQNIFIPSTSALSKAFATRGRWYPQPTDCLRIMGILERRTCSHVGIIDKQKDLSDENQESKEIRKKELNVLPVFAPSRGPGHNIFGLTKWKDGEMIADYVLFEESMKVSKVSWIAFDAMTTEEKSIYVEHLKAIHDKKLTYRCPQTKETFKTVSRLLYDVECCGTGCRHCPYQLENCPVSVKKSLVWNGSFYV